MNIQRSALMTVAVLLLASATVWGQTEDEQTDTSVDSTDTTVEETDTTTADSDIQETAQMPVAIDKAADAGVPESTLEKMSEAMAQADADADTANDAADTAANEEGPAEITNVGDFVTQKVEEGLQGEELSSAIHTHLNEQYGIPAGSDDESAEDGSETTETSTSSAEEDVNDQQTDSELADQTNVGELGATDMQSSTTNGPADQAVQPGRPDSAGPPANAGPPASSDAPASAGPPSDIGAPSSTPASSNAAGPAPSVPAGGPPAGVTPGPQNVPGNGGR